MRLSLILLIILWGGSTIPDSKIQITSFDLVWSDEFDGIDLDTTIWTSVVGDGCPELCGWGNNELQYYVRDRENLRIENGMLVIQAHRIGEMKRMFTSAKLVTKHKQDLRHGRIEVSAKLPTARGTWMAFWMLPTADEDLRWPEDGEIDIVEHVGYNPHTIYGAIHTQTNNGMLGTQLVDSIQLEDVKNEFHVYALEWTEDELIWLADGKQYHHLKRKGGVKSWPFNAHYFHLIVNLAVGGNWGGKHGVSQGDWPQTLVIDYVRYYKAINTTNNYK